MGKKQIEQMFWSKVNRHFHFGNIGRELSFKVATEIREGTRDPLQRQLYTELERVVMFSLLGDTIEGT